MAFMMPVMKNNYDIYKDSRSRKSSECSNNSGSTLVDQRRKVSESKSETFSISPSHHAAYRMQLQRCHSQKSFPRISSRTSAASSLCQNRSFTQASSPPKITETTSNSHGDLSKFHLRLVEKLRKSFRKENSKRS